MKPGSDETSGFKWFQSWLAQSQMQPAGLQETRLRWNQWFQSCLLQSQMQPADESTFATKLVAIGIERCNFLKPLVSCNCNQAGCIWNWTMQLLLDTASGVTVLGSPASLFLSYGGPLVWPYFSWLTLLFPQSIHIQCDHPLGSHFQMYIAPQGSQLQHIPLVDLYTVTPPLRPPKEYHPHQQAGIWFQVALVSWLLRWCQQCLW